MDASRSAAQQAIDNAASQWGWARGDSDRGWYTTYTRGEWSVVVRWTRTGRVGHHDVLQGRVLRRFSTPLDSRKRTTVLTELAAEVA